MINVGFSVAWARSITIGAMEDRRGCEALKRRVASGAWKRMKTTMNLGARVSLEGFAPSARPDLIHGWAGLAIRLGISAVTCTRRTSTSSGLSSALCWLAQITADSLLMVQDKLSELARLGAGRQIESLEKKNPRPS